jgi:hypothetical protein
MGDPVTTSMALQAGSSILGGAMQGQSASDAAQASANAQLEASRMAAEEARFRPIGVTTRFGSSQFGFDPSGRLSSAGYTVSPELQAYQNRLMGLAGGGLTQAEQAGQQYAPLSGAATGLFNLGQQYLAQTPEQVAAQYMASQQDLLAPSRERQMSQLQNQLFQQGRGGLSVGATGARPSGAAGLGATTPEMEAYYNALAQQDAQLATQAQEAGQRQVAFGAGLFGTGADILNQYQTGQVGALDPFKAYLGTSSDIEKLGQQPLQIGSELGGRASTAGARAGEFITQGARNASGYNYQANSYNPFSDVLIGAGTNKDLMRLFGGGTGSGLSIDPYGYGIGSGGMGTVDTSMYGGAFGVPIR